MRPIVSTIALVLLALAAACARRDGGGAFPERGPSDRRGNPATPKVTDDFAQPPQTNDWWSSLVWSFDGNPYSRPMFPHPLAVQAEAEGLGVGYPSEPVIDPRGYRFPYARDLRLGVSGLKAKDARVARYSDWTVTAVWRDEGRRLEATFGHGLPFVYARTATSRRGAAVETTEGDARIELAEAAAPWSAQGEVLGVSVRGHHYGLFAPTGASWKVDGAAITSDLAGKGFFSIAVLPDRSAETLERFRKHAYAFVEGARASWTYDARASKVVSRFELTAALVEPGADRVATPIVALYPHQWKATRAALSTMAPYASPRGAMRLLEDATFTVERAFHGVLPILPDGDEARDKALGALREEAGQALFRPGLDGAEDTYWAGKSLGRAATMAWLARQLGERAVEEHLREAIEAQLDDWSDGKPPKHFVYSPTWRTLVGYPAGYQSGTELNDHHFHYGYFVWAAATLAALDESGRAAKKLAPFVQSLLDDVASPEPGRFPRLRSFDVYAGHSWASGPAMFDDGNNEESSSEDANFAAAMVLWGMATGDDAVRDRGIFLYETLVSAIEQYWLDVDGDIFPKGYEHPVAGIVWGDGVRYDTWWSREPVYVHGINVLPLTGASLYLGRHPDAVRRGQAHLVSALHGPPHQWRDILWMQAALDDAPRVTALVDDEHYFEPEFGNSWAATYYWIYGLRQLGRVDPTVVADRPGHAVFLGPRGRTYAAYNPSPSPIRVTFSDGAILDVPPRALRHATRPLK